MRRVCYWTADQGVTAFRKNVSRHPEAKRDLELDRGRVEDYNAGRV